MSRPRAPPCPSAGQPNAAVAASVHTARINAAGPTPRHPIPMPFSGRFRPPGVPPPPPPPYRAPFYPVGRPPVFPPRVYLRPPPPPGGFIPRPGPPFNPFVLGVPGHTSLHESEPHVCFRRSNDRTRPLPLGFPPRPVNPPIDVVSHQRTAVIDGTFGPVTVVRPHIAPVAPADGPEFKVYVGKIASTVDSDFVLSLLQVCGVVKSWNPVTNPNDGTRTGFGFCVFESAEGSLRARRLLDKLSIDGHELVLTVNEATKVYLQKFGENTTEANAKEVETETRDGMVSLVDNGNDSSRAIPDSTKRGAVVGGQMSSQGKTKRCRYGTEEYSDSDKDAMQKIRIMIEDRMKSKFPCLPTTPSTQPSASIIDEKGDNDMSGSALEEGEIRTQCEKEEHLRETRAVGLQGRKDGEVSAAEKSYLQTDAVSTMHVAMERECTAEHKRKRQHREREFHMDCDEEKGIVCLPGLVSDKHNSSAPGEKVDFESQATSKSGNEKALDAKQLLATVPKMKEELFAYDVNWEIYDKHGLHEKMRPWISEKTTEIFGEEIPEFVDYVVASTKEHVEAPRMLETLATLMDHSAENFALSLWTQLIFEIKKVETGQV